MKTHIDVKQSNLKSNGKMHNYYLCFILEGST